MKNLAFLSSVPASNLLVCHVLDRFAAAERKRFEAIPRDEIDLVCENWPLEIKRRSSVRRGMKCTKNFAHNLTLGYKML